MPSSVLPFLMFQGDGAAALDFYLATFPDAELAAIERYGEGPAPGAIRLARLRLCGQEVMLTDSPIRHAFGFTPSTSFFVECGSEAELRALAATLEAGGDTLMEPGDYGFSRLFTWVADRFGVSWQLNLR